MSSSAAAPSRLLMSTRRAVTKELIRREFIVDYRPGAGVRISPHFYTTDEELELVIKEMKKIGDSESYREHEARRVERLLVLNDQTSTKCQNYGDNPPLSYNKYLRVQDLINLQDCLSTPAHHDELLFITVHQAYELWFKQILHELDAAIQLLEEDRVPAATRALKRVVEIEKLLVNQIHILESMTPISFLAFRDQLNPASGFQSMQFREIEFSSGLERHKHPARIRE